ncbi:MAG TPA: biotin--[acetyl-CoA-carboxylase] ligase [Gemmatimonadales bacterium]|nr:biotin--[acetyl-CoA-carboxylase] ligase [Gemmatimonadales bacterium]
MTQAPTGIRLEVVGSVLDEVHALGSRGAPDGTWVVAVEQREGRGSRGRTWHSPPGGLWLGVLRRSERPDGLDLLSLRAGLAAAAELERLVPGITIRLKWPNDLMLADRKVGGILCEARWKGAMLSWVAIGFGLNVRNPIPTSVAEGAVALATCGVEATADALAGPLASVLAAVDLSSPRLSPAEIAEFTPRDWLLGRSVEVPLAGVGSGIRSDGALGVLNLQGALEYVRFAAPPVGP